MLKVALVSCFDADDAPLQPVWQAIQAHRPEVLLLLGDSIYMDYGLSLGRPRTYKPAKFAQRMYERYAKQWAVPGWLDLLQSVEVVAATWDDHDYAWDGAHGAGTGGLRVPPDKHAISRALFRQFSDCLNLKPSSYPAMPPLSQLLAEPHAGIEHAFDHRGVRFIVTDGRSYRDPRPDNWQDMQRATLFGAAQRDWIVAQQQAQAATGGLSLVCSGSTLEEGSDAWRAWSELDWLTDSWQPQRTLFVAGDIHKNRYNQVDENGRLWHEIISSGAARPKWHGVEGNFAIVEIEGTSVSVRWFGPKQNPGPVQLQF